LYVYVYMVYIYISVHEYVILTFISICIYFPILYFTDFD
jgi:hypothetical protein